MSTPSVLGDALDDPAAARQDRVIDRHWCLARYVGEVLGPIDHPDDTVPCRKRRRETPCYESGGRPAGGSSEGHEHVASAAPHRTARRSLVCDDDVAALADRNGRVAVARAAI